jgi:Tfp pilus assembly protein PilO
VSGFSASIWGGRRLWIWLPPLLFLLVNLVAFIIYHAVYADEAAVSQSRLEEAQDQLETLRARRVELEDYIGRVEGTLERVQQLYDTELASEEERLTTILREVKRLAREAHLEPQSTTYPREELEDYGLTRRAFVFSVQGTYFDLRKLINSLELSEYFLTLEDVSLSEVGGRAGNRLTIALRLSTLFSEDDVSKDGAGPGRGSPERSTETSLGGAS